MKATTILMNEHRVIEQVLNCLEALAKQGLQRGKLDGDSARQALEFFRVFADGCHHRKEERCLFPRLEARGLPRHGGPTGVMLEEHELGRQHLRAMAAALPRAEAGEPEQVERFARFALGYAQLLRDHIFKEDRRLFVLADHALTEQDQEALLRSFEAVEEGDLGEGTHEKYLALADELADRFHVPRAVPSAAEGHGACACGHHGRREGPG
jgi:hemerythrin-like domain-containing protein